MDKDFEAFVDLVQAMRLTQASYFKTRDQTTLVASKRLEKRVDAEIERLTSATPQRTLF
jgi:hypothetical protein